MLSLPNHYRPRRASATLRPRVYVESDVPDDHDDCHSQRRADAITLDDPTAITPIEHAIMIHDLDFLTLRMVDVPGLDDGEQSAQHEAFLNRLPSTGVCDCGGR